MFFEVGERHDGRMQSLGLRSHDVDPVCSDDGLRALDAVCALLAAGAWRPAPTPEPVFVGAPGSTAPLLESEAWPTAAGDVAAVLGTSRGQPRGVPEPGDHWTQGGISLLALTPANAGRIAATLDPPSRPLVDVVLRAFPAAITVGSLASQQVWCTRSDRPARTLGEVLRLLVEVGPSRPSAWAWHEQAGQWMWVSPPETDRGRLVLAVQPD